MTNHRPSEHLSTQRHQFECSSDERTWEPCKDRYASTLIDPSLLHLMVAGLSYGPFQGVYLRVRPDYSASGILSADGTPSNPFFEPELEPANQSKILVLARVAKTHFATLRGFMQAVEDALQNKRPLPMLSLELIMQARKDLNAVSSLMHRMKLPVQGLDPKTMKPSENGRVIDPKEYSIQ